MSEPIRVGIYARLSQDRDGESTSTSRQVDDCRQLAESRGWKVADTYVDRGISGYSGAHRPEFERMLADLEAGRIGGCVAWKLDRVSRNRRDWHRLAELVDAGAVLAAVMDPVDTSTPLGTVVVDLLASMARAESANTSARIRRALEERAEAGEPHPSGGRVFGYARDWQLIPAEADAAREAANRLLAGETLRAVAADFNARGIRTACDRRHKDDDGNQGPRCEGHRWTGSNLKRTLTSPTLAGIRTHRGTERPGTWQPVLDRETWERLRATLERRGHRHRGGGRRVYLLSGLLICGHCAWPMHSHTTPRGARRYRCAREMGGCGRLGILAEGIEDWTRDLVLATLDGPGLAAAIKRRRSQAPDASALVAELDAAEARLESLAADYGEGLMTRAEWQAARKATAERIETLTAQLGNDADTATLVALDGIDLAAWWDDPATTTDRKRAVLDALLESIAVGPATRGGKGWDASRLEPPHGPTWRV